MVDKRDKIQSEALQKWMINKRGTVCLATSLGKMFVFLHALHTMEKNDDVHLFLAETTARKVDLIKSIKTFDEKFNKNTLDDYNLKFYCYQTVYKWRNKSFGLVTCDECHVQLSPSYIQFHKFNTYKAVLGLSATIDRSTEYESRGVVFTKGDMLDKYMPVCYTYTLDKARINDINREVDIHIIYNELDYIDKCIATKKNSKTLLTEVEAYKHWNKRLAQSMFADPSKREIVAYMAINGRSKLLYNLPSKTRIVKELLPHLNNTLIFANSIDSLLTVTDNVISSRNSEKKNNFIRHEFEQGNEDVIGSFKMLEQGATIDRMHNMIMMSYYSKSLSAIQKMGRHRKIGNTKGNAFILVTKDTQEEKWLSKFIGNFKAYNILKHNNVQECIDYLKNET